MYPAPHFVLLASVHLLWVAGGVVALFWVLAVWQRRVDARQRAHVVERIREAKSLGADRPVGQYPQIDPLACIGCGSCIRACPEEEVIGLVDGVAHVIHASRCVGHARCAEVCPVGALTVGLGDLRTRTDVPKLTAEMETSVPGVFIAGELGGLALIRNAVEQGSRVVETIARRVPRGRPVEGLADLLIVGAGPAGLSASLKARELKLRAVTIDQNDLGGTVSKYPRRKLVLTQPVKLPLGERIREREYAKEDLVAFFERIIQKHEVPIRTRVKMLGLEPAADGFVASTSEGPIRARFVVLALGRRGTPTRLGVPGEEQEKVLYQLIDTAGYTGRHVLVVGGGDSAIEAATGLANQPGNTVTLSYRKPAFFRLKRRNEERIRSYAEEGRVRLLLGSQVASIEPHRVILNVGGGAPVEIPNDDVFIFAGGEPPYPLLRSLGVGFCGDSPRQEEVRV